MYLGIDLGTSNSAIVGNAGGTLRHFKTPDGMDVLPSAIMFDRRGGLLVGRRAYDQSAFSPENVALGFKRMMGTSSALKFANGGTLTPEDASAEILKALVGQARMTSGDFEIEGAVITIPAAFNQMQCEATMRAAALAGLANVALLQEPIAAALASIAQSENKNGQFLVYDLGGGTFDAAIVQTINGAATVIAHAGINMLGGRDFDRAIVNSIVRPWLLENFSLADDFQKNAAYDRLLRVAHFRAEATKIALSTQEVDRIYADESQLGAKDARGVEIYIDVEVTRGELERLVKADIDRSIELCRSLIGESGYRPEDLDRVVLIGGPSRMPVVRAAIGTELGIRADLNADPMTAVACGAAIFAESREWGVEGAVTKKARDSKISGGSIAIKYDYPTRIAAQQFRIRVRVESADQAGGAALEIRDQFGWTSGRLDLSSLNEVRDIPLRTAGDNKFEIIVFDRFGEQLHTSSTVINVFRSDASAAAMPMPHNLAIKVVSNATGIAANALATFVKKGTLLPKRGSEQFRVSRDLRPGDGTYLDFEIYQQEDEDVSDPVLNLPVGSFRLKSSDLDKGDVVRRGDPVVVHWSIDENGLLDCQFEFSEIQQTYALQHMYISALGHRDFDGDGGYRLASTALNDARNDVDSLEFALGENVAATVARLRSRIEKQREMLRFSVDAEGRRRICEEGRLIRQEVAKAKSKPEHQRAVLRSDLEIFVGEFATSLSGLIEERVKGQIQRLAGAARESLSKSSLQAVQDARRTFDEMRALLLDSLERHPEFWVARFQALAEERDLAIDKALHDSLVRDGELAIARKELDQIRELTLRLAKNRLQNGAVGGSAILAGLTRD